MVGETLVITEHVVKHHAHLNLGSVEQAATVKRKEEVEGLDQMGSDSKKNFSFPEIHAHQSKVEHFQITESAMNDACGCGGGAAAEIAFLEEGHFETAQCGVSGDAGTDDSTADYD